MNKNLLIRIAVTALMGLLLLAVFVPPVTRTVFESGPFAVADAAGEAYVDAAFKRALVAFALARTANAVISVIQGSEVDVAPAGIGVTLALGEALDPLNDMIERFSWVMLFSLVSLGIQKLLLEIVPWFSLTLVLAPALVLLVFGVWWPTELRRLALNLGWRLLLLAMVLRFCIPLTAWLNDSLYEQFLAQHYTAAVGDFEQGNAMLERLGGSAAAGAGQEQGGFWGQLRDAARNLPDVSELQQQIETLKSRFGAMVEQLLTMIAVFLLSAVLLPLAFLWLMLRLSRKLLSGFPANLWDQGLLRKASR